VDPVAGAQIVLMIIVIIVILRIVIMVIMSIVIMPAVAGHAGMSIVWILGLWRFVLGLGVGGDYSLNASIITEYSSRHFRGALIAALFAMQGFGILSAALLAMAVLAIKKVCLKRRCECVKVCEKVCVLSPG
jgi:MFS family permease